MYDISSGSIIIDGKSITKHNLSHLRKQIAYVPQDVFLFSDTISNNISFGNPSVNKDKIIEYAKHTAVYDDIMGFPEQFDPRVRATTPTQSTKHDLPKPSQACSQSTAEAATERRV